MKKIFYFLKLLIIIVSFLTLLIILIKNIDYYSYCKLSQYKKKLFEKNEKSKKYGELCNDIFKDFSDHTFLKYSLKYIYNIIRPENAFKNMSDENALRIIENIESSYLATLKSNLKIFKLFNFVFYVMLIYLIFIIFPEILTKFLINVLNKILYFLFLYFVVEGFINFYTDIRINIKNIISVILPYLPIKLFTSILKYIRLFVVFILQKLHI